MYHSNNTNALIPFFGSTISAGFASPADDHLDKAINLHEYLVERPASTFLLRVSGDSMSGAGILDKSLVVVDRSIRAKNNSIVIAAYHGDLTIKRLRRNAEGIWLMPENPAYKALHIRDETQFQIWGCVTYVIQQVL